jgi:hypothetical protein
VIEIVVAVFEKIPSWNPVYLFIGLFDYTIIEGIAEILPKDNSYYFF